MLSNVNQLIAHSRSHDLPIQIVSSLLITTRLPNHHKKRVIHKPSNLLHFDPNAPFHNPNRTCYQPFHLIESIHSVVSQRSLHCEQHAAVHHNSNVLFRRIARNATGMQSSAQHEKDGLINGGKRSGILWHQMQNEQTT